MSTVLAVDWGDVPTWVSAITTLGALLAAGLVVFVELRRDKRATERGERGEQAGMVAAWPQDGPAGVVIRNGSPLPVYDVRVAATWSGFDEDGRRLPDDDFTIAAESVMPPGDLRVEWPEEIFHLNQYDVDLDRRAGCSLVVGFTDTAGRRWFRASSGVLVKVPGVSDR